MSSNAPITALNVIIRDTSCTVSSKPDLLSRDDIETNYIALSITACAFVIAIVVMIICAVTILMEKQRESYHPMDIQAKLENIPITIIMPNDISDSIGEAE